MTYRKWCYTTEDGDGNAEGDYYYDWPSSPSVMRYDMSYEG